MNNLASKMWTHSQRVQASVCSFWSTSGVLIIQSAPARSVVRRLIDRITNDFTLFVVFWPLHSPTLISFITTLTMWLCTKNFPVFYRLTLTIETFDFWETKNRFRCTFTSRSIMTLNHREHTSEAAAPRLFFFLQNLPDCYPLVFQLNADCVISTPRGFSIKLIIKKVIWQRCEGGWGCRSCCLTTIAAKV